VGNLHFVPCAENVVLEYGTAATVLDPSAKNDFVSARDIFTSAKSFSASANPASKSPRTQSRRASTREAQMQTRAKLSEFAMAIGNGNEEFGKHRLKAWQVLYCGGTQAIVDTLQRFSNDFTVAFKKEKFDW